MKHVTSLVLTALFAWLPIAGLPLSQPAAQEDSAAQDDPAVEGTPASEPVPFSEDPSLLYVTELIERAELYAGSIAELTVVPAVELLEVSALVRADTSAEIFVDTVNRLMSNYSDDIAALRSAMESNPVVADALEADGIAVSDIVAAEIRPDLALRVYIRDW